MILDEVQKKICKTQGKVYEYMQKKGYDIHIFSDVYLVSDFVQEEFDTVYSRFQWEFPITLEEIFMPEIGSLLVKGESTPFAFEIGYIYRMLYFFTNIPSAELVKKFPYEKVAKASINAEHYGYEEVCKELVKECKISRA